MIELEKQEIINRVKAMIAKCREELRIASR